MIEDISRTSAYGRAVEAFGAYLNFLLILAERNPILFPFSVDTSQVLKASSESIVNFPMATAFNYSGLYPN